VRPAAAPDAPATNSTQLAASREMLQALEWELAQHVGPVARALVQRAAQRAYGPVQLIELLAADIDDAAGRAEFVAAARTLARRLTS